MLSGAGQPGVARRDFLVEVAWLHHECGLDQRAIARRFGVSRSTVSRALSEASKLGIIQVTVTEEPAGAAGLAAALRDRYAVSAHVSQRIDREPGMRAAARATAKLLERIVAAGHVSIAASWGRTLAVAASLVRPWSAPDVTVVDCVGHARGEQMAPAIDVTNALASAWRTTVTHLQAPAFPGSPEAQALALAKPRVSRTLRQARGADVILISVGVVGEASLLRQEGLLTGAQMGDLVRRGAVGEVLGQYFNALGQPVEAPTLSPVGLTLDDLRQGRRVIAAAGGPEKAGSLRAAIVGGLVDEVVVDDGLACALLEEDCADGGEP